MTAITLVEPHSSGRTSGGYLYNHRIAQYAADVTVVSIPEGSLATTLAGLVVEPGDLVLADSLFLSEAGLEPFFALRKRHPVAVGVLLHAFPSFIARASDRSLLARSLPLAPTAEELTLLSKLDLVVTPGENVQALLTAAGCDVHALVCRPGVDRVPPREPRSVEPGAPVKLIIMGKVGPLKGIADALEALALLDDSAFELMVVGDTEAHPEHVAELRALTARLGLAARTQFTGAISHDRALAELRENDALLLPSYTENAPLVVLEALAAGVPVVGYAVGDVPHLVAMTDAGLLVPVLDIPSLSAALGRFLRDPAERADRSARARAAGPLLPTWAQAAEDFSLTIGADLLLPEWAPPSEDFRRLIDSGLETPDVTRETGRGTSGRTKR